MAKEDRNSNQHERILVLAPTSGDGALSRSVLREAGLECKVVSGFRELCAELESGAAVILLTEQTLVSSEPACLTQWLNKQPGWSDLPIVLMAQQGADSPVALNAIESLGNVTVLEQPVRISTLLSSLRTAIRARERQYELRDQVEAQALLAAIIQSSDDAIVSKSLDGIILSWNAGAERVFGYPAEEAIDQPITLIIPPELHQEEKKILERLRNGQRIDHFETVRVAKDGRRLDVSLSISPVRDRSGRIIGASKVARDITDRKRAERQLQESEERFRFLAETIPSIVFTSDPNGKLTYVNKRWLEYFGMPADQIEMSWADLPRHPDDEDRCRIEWSKALRDGKQFDIEVRNRRYDGVYRWFVTRAVPLRNSSGRIVSWFGVTTDIHDQKQMQDQLREADRLKDEFLATLAHELRNPLAPIKNSVQFLRMSGGVQANGNHAAEIIDRQVNHLVRLVDDLLEVSRITRGRVELRKEAIELIAIVNNAVETSKPVIDAAGHDLEVSLPLETLTLDADPVRLSQVLANLLNNAAKYTDPGGKIWLTARREADEVVVSVRDTGVGIPSAILPHIFEMFVQADRSLGRSQGGLGIGLTLAQTLVKQHGGRIEARSEGPGRGSEFIVRLPLRKEQTAEEAGAPTPDDSVAASNALRILVVDDNKDSAESLSMCLGLSGHRVEMVHQGLAALETAFAYRPDVIVLDIGLPDIDGYQVATRLRQQPAFAQVLLIALTGYGQEEDRQRCFDAGFDEHMVKPADPALLEETLAMHFHERRGVNASNTR